jgi:hypothetical protein
MYYLNLIWSPRQKNRKADMNRLIRMKSLKIFAFFTLFTLSNGVLAECNVLLAHSTPNGQLRNNGDGTVTDVVTSLMWKQCGEGQSGSQCDGAGSTYSWDLALQVPQNLNSGGGFAGLTDWRLPTIKELMLIIETACRSPSLNQDRFPGFLTGSVWSSTPARTTVNLSWTISLSNGITSEVSRTGFGSVWLVRDKI